LDFQKPPFFRLLSLFLTFLVTIYKLFGMKTKIVKLTLLCTALLNAQTPYETSESFALNCDLDDPLRNFRDEFFIPKTKTGDPLIYFCGHSLGLEPKRTPLLMEQELKYWSELGVEGHFKEDAPWYSYHCLVRNSLANLVGANPDEVVAMNSLTVNLHLMVSFYQPTKKRFKILMEEPVFSSDTYAIKSQIQYHGFDPETSIIVVKPKNNEFHLRMEEIEEVLTLHGDEIALVLFSGVNYITGQYIDIERVSKKAHEKGAVVGFDLAHAIGNLPLYLHEWNVDFAVWCSYKYLNSGPGAIGGAFIHEKHHKNWSLNRFAGWWGNDPKTRFQLHLQPDFIPTPSADGWQLSNPSIFSLVPLRSSLEIFEQAGIENLRKKSVLLTGYLEYLIKDVSIPGLTIITPSNPAERGCSISILVENDIEELITSLEEAQIRFDFRPPNILRITPAPLYNTFHEVWRFGKILEGLRKE
jgi:kynureninase